MAPTLTFTYHKVISRCGSWRDGSIVKSALYSSIRGPELRFMSGRWYPTVTLAPEALMPLASVKNLLGILCNTLYILYTLYILCILCILYFVILCILWNYTLYNNSDSTYINTKYFCVTKSIIFSNTEHPAFHSFNLCVFTIHLILLSERFQCVSCPLPQINLACFDSHCKHFDSLRTIKKI